MDISNALGTDKEKYVPTDVLGEMNEKNLITG